VIATMKRVLVQLLCDDDAQDLIEYALLAAFISIIAVTAIKGIGAQVNLWYVGYAATIKTIPSGGS
jgi:Flp pilus assembly pilin Flp